jgi:hypothetical protein
MEKLGEFFPLIIFLFWVIFGVLFKTSIKNRKKAPETRPRQDERPSTPAKKKTGANLKDAIQMVLEEMDLSGREESVFSGDTAYKEENESSVSFERSIPAVPETVREAIPAEKREVPEIQPYKRAFVHPYRVDNRHEGEFMAGMVKHREEIRRGIIWSEILSPPLALRETDRIESV